MKVILQKDLKDLGRVGDMVNVAIGYARNFLFPRKLSSAATEKRLKEWGHLQKIAEAKKKKGALERQPLLQKLEGVTVDFKLKTFKGDKLFGAITNADICARLNGQGFVVNKRDIIVKEPIRTLGQHNAFVKLGEGQEANIKVLVERDGQIEE